MAPTQAQLAQPVVELARLTVVRCPTVCRRGGQSGSVISHERFARALHARTVLNTVGERVVRQLGERQQLPDNHLGIGATAMRSKYIHTRGL